MDFLNALRTHFQDDRDIVALVEGQISSVVHWIADHEEYEEEREERLIGRIELPVVPQSGRSIFDDIDVE